MRKGRLVIKRQARGIDYLHISPVFNRGLEMNRPKYPSLVPPMMAVCDTSHSLLPSDRHVINRRSETAVSHPGLGTIQSHLHDPSARVAQVTGPSNGSLLCILQDQLVNQEVL